MEYIHFKGQKIPYIGFGTWLIGDDKSKENQEIETILFAINKYDMTLIDTAEMYGEGRAEAIVGKVMDQVDRNKIFLVNKILPTNAKKGRYIESVKHSLELCHVDYFDLYLLHWRSDVDLADMVFNMEELVKLGYIKHWGVSNFDTKDMEELFKIPHGSNCFANQVLYNVGSRGIEYDLIPWCKKHDVLVMAYSPLYNSKEYRETISLNNSFKELAKKEDKTPESLMLSFVVRNRDLVTIFKTSSIPHLAADMYNVFKPISGEGLNEIDTLFPAPKDKVDLEKI